MSTSFSTNTFIIKKENIPSSLYNAFENLSQDAPYNKEHCNDAEQMKSVYGSSRNGWAGWKLSEVLPEFGAKNLNFLLGKNARFRREDLQYGSFDQVTFLDTPEILEETIKELDSFFEWSLQNTEKLSDILEKASPDEITNIVSLTTVSSFPSIDSHIWYAEDGDNVEYLYGYLRSILAVLKYALKHGFAVGHIEDGEFTVENN
jgi:hypothetical protein